MACATIGQNESPEQLSARLNRPVCMLLRANRLYSTQWLLPGRQIVLPEADFCRCDSGLCPLKAMQIPAESFVDFVPEMIQLPDRLRRWSAVHGNLALPQWRSARWAVIRPQEGWNDIAARLGTEAAELQRINRYFGPPVPGIELVYPVSEAAETGMMDTQT